jgi:hypothetical protein
MIPNLSSCIAGYAAQAAWPATTHPPPEGIMANVTRISIQLAKLKVSYDFEKLC